MPERKRIARHTSKEVNGEGSWVVVSQLTVGELREIRKASEKKNFDQEAQGYSILQTHVLEWNWVDDDGEPMPQIKDDPSVIDTLINPEVKFLTSCILGDETARKN